MRAFEINLKEQEQRDYYNHSLELFEKQFNYPLGDKKFNISHGKDYFAFFEQLGETHFFVIEDKNKIVGAICAILRRNNNYQSWYLCDFKIAPEYRGKKLYRAWMWRYFLKYYLRNRNVFYVNMNNTNNNKVFKHSQNIFKIFSLHIQKNYLYQFSKNEYDNLPLDIKNNYYLVSNSGKKDIIIDGACMPLFHMVQNNNLTFKDKVDILPENSQIMLLSQQKIHSYPYQEVSWVQNGKQMINISSAEI